MDAEQSIFRCALGRILRANLGLWLVGCALLASGCKTDRNRELLEQELRWQEDEIYHLENHLEDYQKKIESLKCENDSLRNGGVPVKLRPSRELLPPAPSISPERSPSKRSDADNPEKPGLPMINLGSPSSRPGSVNTTSPDGFLPLRSAKDAGSFELPDPNNPTSHGEAPPYNPAGDRPTSRDEPTQLLLNPTLTGGWAARGKANDEGIRVVMQPVNANGKPVRIPGAITVVLLDPSLDGDQSRVARWDISLEQAKELFRNASSEGVRLDLRWPNGPPANRELQLFVRYALPNGSEMVADQVVSIKTGGSDNVPRGTLQSVTKASDRPTPAEPAIQGTDQSSSSTLRPLRPGLLNRSGDDSSPKLLGRRPIWSPDR